MDAKTRACEVAVAIDDLDDDGPARPGAPDRARLMALGWDGRENLFRFAARLARAAAAGAKGGG